ncbi:MAG: LEA type 2 family protein, partial [Ignavibacteria bacterium]|nr:LEA type 2 family protein [Ignavibacteria bacterium]
MNVRRLISLLLLISLLGGCSVLKTLENVSRLKYKIHSAVGYKVLGISIDNKKSIKDFNSLEMLKLSSGILKGSLPLTFSLNIEAKNPNDGSGGYPQTDLTLESFPYKLFINDKEIITGDIDSPVLVPGKGESTLIALNIEFDIAKSFKEKSLDDILSLLLNL